MEIHKKSGTKGRLFEMMERVNKVNLNESYEDFNTSNDNSLPNSYSEPSAEEIEAAKNEYRKSGIDVSNLNSDEFNTMMADHQYSKNNESVGKIEGGLADNKSPEEYDREQLKRGMSVEKEHTNDPAVALEITMDHTEEDPNYYGTGNDDPNKFAQKHSEKEANNNIDEIDNINFTSKSNELVSGMKNLINSIDESMGYDDLAIAIAQILKDDYGSHNFEPFLIELQKQLNT